MNSIINLFKRLSSVAETTQPYHKRTRIQSPTLNKPIHQIQLKQKSENCQMAITNKEQSIMPASLNTKVQTEGMIK